MQVPHTKMIGGTYYYFRRVPRAVEHLDTRRFVKRTLGTRDVSVARKKAAAIDRELEIYWEELEQGRPEAARDRHDAIVRICRAQGFSYKAATTLEAEAEWRDILTRVQTLMEASAGQAPPAELADALLGGSEAKEMTLSQAFEIYFETSEDKIARKSPKQAHRWALPRRAAAKHMIDTITDLPLSKVDVDQLWRWRDALWERVSAGEIAVDTANKQIHYVSAMLNDVGRKRRIPVPSLRDLSFSMKREGERTKREKRTAYTVAEIEELFLRNGRLMRMNEEARRVVFAMIETGARPSEIVNLRPEHIVLDADIPHIAITDVADRELKTEAAPRTIPLVGASLMALKAQPTGWDRYRDNGDALSAAVNKFLAENGMRPTKKHTLYSLRHSFEDRMGEAENPDGRDDRFRAELMGHQYDLRERYGSGPSLERKHKLLINISLSTPNTV